jgi:hypothetical protein
MTFEYYETLKPKLWDPKTFHRAISNYCICTYDPHISPDTNPRPNKSILHPDKLPSADNMTEEELVSILDIPACTRSDFPMLGEIPIRQVVREQARKALFDEVLAKEILPELQVVFIGAELTVLGCVWGKLVLQKKYADAVEQGRQARPIRFIEIKGANHFVSLVGITWTNTGRIFLNAGSLG